MKLSYVLDYTTAVSRLELESMADGSSSDVVEIKIYNEVLTCMCGRYLNGVSAISVLPSDSWSTTIAEIPPLQRWLQ